MNTTNTESHLLDGIRCPEDLRKLRKEDLPRLAGEIRERIIKVVLANGGHLASNLGVVELTLALHRVFESPRDTILWDVGHQCYTHKILTGRNDLFDTIRKKDGLSGFPKRSESPHDILETGHSSTSVSAGIGVLVGKRSLKDPGKVIVVVGDGALTAGMAYEGLNYAGYLGRDLIIVYNDNNMSISKNIGGISVNSNLSKLSSYVSRLAMTPLYQKIRDKLDRGVQGIPVVGYKLYELMMRLKRTLKAVTLKETIFSEMGYEYVGPVDGHSIPKLTRVLEGVKNFSRPVVVHVLTKKGKGYEKAEHNPSLFHGISPMVRAGDKVEKKSSLTFTEAFTNSLVAAAGEDERIVAVSAAMGDGTGLSYFKENFPERFYDVGIAEQHAVTFSAGLAIAGLKPVTAIYSTFMQRAVDQVIHDLALQRLPVIIAMDRAGLVPDDGETHQGLYDIPLFRAVPHLSFLAPADHVEMDLMLRWALRAVDGPVLLRYPKSACPDTGSLLDRPVETGRGVMVKKNDGDLLLISVGGLFQEAREAVHLSARRGIGVDLFNLRFIKPIDEEYLASVMKSYARVFLVEDGAQAGGIGEYIAGMVHRLGLKLEFRWAGVPDTFLCQASRAELIQTAGLDRYSIAERIGEMLSSSLSIVRPRRDLAASE